MAQVRFNWWDRIVISWRCFWARRRKRALPLREQGLRVEFSETFRRMKEKGWDPASNLYHDPDFEMVFWTDPVPKRIERP